jgi:16S rRNA processing protein RimM
MDESSFIYSEVVGYDVVDIDRGSVGFIKNVNSGVAQDLIVVEKADGETFMIPCVKAFVQGFDHDKKVVNVTLIEGIM